MSSYVRADSFNTDTLLTKQQTGLAYVSHDFSEGLLPSADPIDSVKYYIDKAQAVMSKIRETQNYISNLNDVSLFQLPVGIPKLVNGLNYDIGIYAIRLLPTHAEVDVLMQFEMPQNGKVLTFQAKGIKFTRAGGIVGDAKLSLVGDYGINFTGDKVQLILHGSLAGTGTYVTMDCDGFKEMGLDAEVKFSRDILVPEDASGNVKEGNVSAAFKANLSNWNDLLIQLSMPAFQVQSLKGFGFTASDAVFDFSDTRNAPSVVFPENYQSSQFLPGNQNLWRGFYMRELSVRMPAQFEKKSGGGKTTLSATNLIIDSDGISGFFAGSNLLPLKEGNMNGWAFSVDSLAIELQANELMHAGFKGDIVVPVSGEKTPLNYQAVISDGNNYLFSVSPAKDMEFDLWKAGKVEIYESSYIEVRVQDKKFLPKASLNGRMNVKASLSQGGQGVELADIRFEKLEIQSVRPFLKVGSFSFGSEAAQQKMAGFPISIKNVALKNVSDTEVALDFNLLLNLVGEEGGSFAADAGLSVIGTMNAESGWQTWRYKEVNVRSIKVDINGGAFKINGSLTFYRNDVSYGDGFNGVVKAEFTPNIKVSATAIFGNVKGYRYWYADAMASFKPGIPVFPGVAFYGFGGGAYYRMKMDNTGAGSELGKTASGVVYIPDEKSGLGIKAILNIGTAPDDKAFNGDITFEISFYKGGGVRFVSLTGNGFIATPGLDASVEKLKASASKMADAFDELEKTAASTGAGKIADQESMMTAIHGDLKNSGEKGAISARMFISYDFENRILHGNFNAKINVASILTGGGEAVLHFAPEEWYVYIGTPDNRFNLSVGIGPIRAGTDSYFMVGTKIPGSPPPPAKVAKILGGKNYDYMKSLNDIGKGAGFAFGASLNISTGDLKFLMFYARFDAGAGFDIMLKNYPSTYCAQTNRRIGINGWYANGQAYAYFDGSIGIRVRVFGRRKKVEILSIGAAALLQAQLPNPFWMRGAVGGHFSVLGGLVRGNCKFEITLGDQCDIIKKESEERAVDDIQVIAQLTPAAGETEVSVFNTPQVVFNMPVDKEFKLVENEQEKSFKIKLDHYKLVTASGQVIPGTIEWNENHDVLAYNSFEVLPPSQDIKSIVQVSFEEKISGNWVPVQESGKIVLETSEISYKTGPAPDYIPHSNIAYSYPIIGQVNLYRDENREGYIKLIKGQSYLFEPGSEWKQIGRMTDATGGKIEHDFTYSNSTVNFNIPSDLKTGSVYTFELVNVPSQRSGAVDRNVSEVTNKIQGGDESVSTEVATKKAEGSISDLQEKSIFNGYFRSSTYPTLNAKLNALTKSNGTSWQIYNGVHELSFRYAGAELFDKYETGATSNTESLMKFEAVLDNDWYTDRIAPLLYEGYPVAGLRIKHRAEQSLGVPPIMAVFFREQSDMVLKDPVTPIIMSAAQASVVYNLPLEMARDYSDLVHQAANYSISSTNTRINALLTTPYPNLPAGVYNIRIRYVLPGTKKVTTERIIPINYVF
ncbi:MAG: hypothetical protein ACOYXT_15185 [Bacteroidota bacterium]